MIDYFMWWDILQTVAIFWLLIYRRKENATKLPYKIEPHHDTRPHNHVRAGTRYDGAADLTRSREAVRRDSIQK